MFPVLLKVNIEQKILEPEGRRLEFKESLPTNSDLTKTIIAFANDAGGELIIGVKDGSREVVGVDRSKLSEVENRISNVVYDNCLPAIFLEVSFFEVDEKCLIRVYIHKGGKPPYYRKSKGKEEGTFIRVGSSNRVASKEIIVELERQGDGVSFDGEVCLKQTVEETNINDFYSFFEEQAKEKLTKEILRKLGLIRIDQGRSLLTNALILLSDDDLKNQMFP